MTRAPIGIGALLLGAMFTSCHHGGTGGAGGDGGGPPIAVDPYPNPNAPPALVADGDPTAPDDDGGHGLSWPQAPLMTGVTVEANRDSAVVYLPDTEGAHDYRVVLLPAGVEIAADGDGEVVKGSTLFCAGYRQHAAPFTSRELLRRVEVTGLEGPTRMVIEALDRACPFPGIRGQAHVDIGPPPADVEPIDAVPTQVLTDQEIAARYGSVIINGHGHGQTLAAPAPPSAPRVLARTTIVVTPTAAAPPPVSTFFDDFAEVDQPVFVKEVVDGGRSQFGKLLQNKKWSFFTYDAGLSQIYVDRRSLRMVLNDWSEDVMSTNFAVPRRPAALSSDDYLHLHFEVENYATPRRYWWIFLCGAAEAGQTFDASGTYLGNIVQTPFFMQDDGLNPSLDGWNCLQLFARDGYPFPLPPDNQNPQTEVRLIVNRAGDLGRDNVKNPNPIMYPPEVGPPSWYRQVDAQGKPTAPILDDQQLVSPRTRFDLYVRRDRAVLLVNGEQRLCNDFPATPLTMAEAGVGFGQVLYHSSGERVELPADYWDRRGQRYIYENSPYIDVRTFDNLGYDEHVAAPPGFDESLCYKPQG